MRFHVLCRALLVLVTSGVGARPEILVAQTPAGGDLPALVVLVRHAEPASEPADNPPLADAGTRRAQALAATLRNAKLSAVITSQLQRTIDTARPTAAALGLTPQAVPVLDRDAHVKAVAAAVRVHAGGSVLVVSHSNIVPAIIAALGGPRLPDICETVYDHLFALVPAAGSVQLVDARYGNVSGPAGRDCM